MPQHESLATGLQATVTITNMHGLHARPVATLVSGLRDINAQIEFSNLDTGAGPAPGHSVTRIAALGLRCGQRMQIVAAGPQAEQAIATIEKMAKEQFGEAAEIEPTALAEEIGDDNTGQQIVIGPAYCADQQVDTSKYQVGADEVSKLQAALAAVDADLAAQVQGSHGDIFAAQQALLSDVELRERFIAAAPSSAVASVEKVLTEVAASFDQLADPYLRERAQDIRSLQRQILEKLVGAKSSSLSVGKHVLIVAELDAATAATLDTSLTQGIITTTGGATGHGVIVASSRGIPVLTGCHEAAAISDQTIVAFDPCLKKLWINPDEATLSDISARAIERAKHEQQAAALAHEPAISPQGIEVIVEANIASQADAERGYRAGAQGSGLVRTELLFGHLNHAPSAEYQAQALIEIGTALGGHPITVRTWDVGGDKPLAFLPQDKELNPFLGERGIRTMRRVPELLKEQLTGILLASQQVPVRVMFPMVTEPQEMQWAREQLETVRRELGVAPIPVGMMIEMPAAALRAGDFKDFVDFVSIGTNDLTQYTTAADRGNGVVQHLARSDSAAVWDLIALTCQQLPDTTIAVCGDLASQTEAVPKLVALGVTELSVRPPLVGLIKQAIRQES
ncbi:MAG: putative PEP-binding protein [Propionibacteriaceae bacterium]